MVRNCAFLLSASLWLLSGWPARQSEANDHHAGETYTLTLPVDEVVLTFNAVDKRGTLIHDLKAGEIQLWDNGVHPRKIVSLDELADRPIRFGILIDTSDSMQSYLPRNRAIGEQFLERLFRQKSDEAFVASFGYASDTIQPWTGNVSSLLKAIEGARSRADLPGGTALLNSVFRACSSSLGKVDPTATGNFILLFSDGEDNAGLTSMDEAARACQRSNTQVFAFLPFETQRQASTGPNLLRELTAKTNGRVFLVDDSEETISTDLEVVESEMRNQYRLVYTPADFKHDGAFHEILIQPPDRVERIEVRAGYFAPRP
jgi:Ca-activated chloride channel family protein